MEIIGAKYVYTTKKYHKGRLILNSESWKEDQDLSFQSDLAVQEEA